MKQFAFKAFAPSVALALSMLSPALAAAPRLRRLPARTSLACRSVRTFARRPIPLGVSGSNLDSSGQGFCCSGTLGSLVQDARGTQYVLSNNHVLGRTNLGSPGEPIIQPGLADLMCMQNSGDSVASLTRLVPIMFDGSDNTVDAAIAEVEPGAVEISGAIANIGPISGTIDSSPLGILVQKMGRTTCVTRGKVSAVSVTLHVFYPRVCNEAAGAATFTNQIMITPGTFSSGGDSGSLVVTTESCPRAVGMVFAGSRTGSFANPIADVLNDLGVSMFAGCMSPTTTTKPSAASAPESAGTAASSVRTEAIGAATLVKRRHEAELFATSGVVGTGIGLSEHPGEPVIEVYVRQDTPEVRASLPKALDGVAVRLVETGEVTAY